MREVEFLPNWYPQLRKRRRMVYLQGWMTLLLIAGMGLYMVMADRNIAMAQRTLDGLKGQLSQTQTQLTEMDKLDGLRKQWQQQDQVLSRLGLYVEASSLMQALDTIMPRQMSLLSLTLDNEEKEEISAVLAAKGTGEKVFDRKLKVKMQGVCPTDTDLANFMTQLSSVPFFEQVNITYAKNKEENNHVLREFELTMFLNLNSGGN